MKNYLHSLIFFSISLNLYSQTQTWIDTEEYFKKTIESIEHTTANVCDYRWRSYSTIYPNNAYIDQSFQIDLCVKKRNVITTHLYSVPHYSYIHYDRFGEVIAYLPSGNFINSYHNCYPRSESYKFEDNQGKIWNAIQEQKCKKQIKVYFAKCAVTPNSESIICRISNEQDETLYYQTFYKVES